MVTYFVVKSFERTRRGALVECDPVEAAGARTAVALVRRLADHRAGAVAFSRTGDPTVGEYDDAVVLACFGEVDWTEAEAALTA